jgi:hypothetical protein
MAEGRRVVRRAARPRDAGDMRPADQLAAMLRWFADAAARGEYVEANVVCVLPDGRRHTGWCKP